MVSWLGAREIAAWVNNWGLSHLFSSTVPEFGKHALWSRLPVPVHISQARRGEPVPILTSATSLTWGHENHPRVRHDFYGPFSHDLAPTLRTWYPTSPRLPFYKPKLFSQRLQLQGVRRRVRTGAETGSRVKPTGDPGIFDRIITTERWSCTIMIKTLNRPPRGKPRQHVESSSLSQKGKQAAWIEGPWGIEDVSRWPM